MIDRTALLEDLKRLVTRVEGDLLARSEDADVPEIASVLRGEYERARAAKRTADTYGKWREDRITQTAVAWVLSCVFVRFLEDNDLIAPPRVAGPGERLRQARDAHQHYFLSHPRDTDREYLLSIFDELAASPGTSGIFGPHNALREIPNWLSGDKAREVIQFFQKIDADTGLLIHDFTDPTWDTRFLGDLYQDLSAYARERYALLQTPHFIEQFLLDRTLEPAVEEFGLQNFKMIDPACGSGHLVLGSFERLLDRWQRVEPATAVRELVRRTLASVHGVDINPFAVAIARFRLLLVAMRACEIKRLADAPDFILNIECGDSLLHVPLVGGQTQLFDKHEGGEELPKRGRDKKAKAGDDECEHAYSSENLAVLKAVLRHGQYHAVMANPPYIVVRDHELNQRYRKRFETCHRQYSLSVPFMEHIYGLCIHGGYTGQITSNSFMKREFGKPLIEKFFPTVNLTHVIDSSGPHIPGHKTPTVILFGRRQPPLCDTVRAVMGIRGDPSTPVDPSIGPVWMSIVQQIDHPGSQNEFISVADTPRNTFSSHPWTLGGGGITALKQQLDDSTYTTLRGVGATPGIASWPGIDEACVASLPAALRHRLEREVLRHFVSGDVIRDWTCEPEEIATCPYASNGDVVPLSNLPHCQRFAWPLRTVLLSRVLIGGQSFLEAGLPYHAWVRMVSERYRGRHRIVFSFIATHNHFILDRGEKVFNRSAPVITLPSTSTEDNYLAVLGLLNSSTACFWMKQVFYPKASATGELYTEKGRPEDNRYEFAGTALEALPIPSHSQSSAVVISIASALEQCAADKSNALPQAILRSWMRECGGIPLRKRLADAAHQHEVSHRRMVALQEELDWEIYKVYGLDETGASDSIIRDIVEENAGISPEARPFLWQNGVPDSSLPPNWRATYTTRYERIHSSQSIRIIEDAVFKRPWWGRQGIYGRLARNYSGWQTSALDAFLLERLERLFDFDGRMNDAGKPTAVLPIGLVSIGSLADAASHDPLFMEAAEVFVGAAGFDVTSLVGQLVEKASVPFLPVLRYKATGLRKHEEWKEVWELQRKEDAIDARTTLLADNRNQLTTKQAADLKRREVGDIPVPPKYASADFASSTYWSLRGKLDVPKERFLSFPFVTGADGQMMIVWAGLDHLQLAKAIGDFYGLVQNDIGGSDDPRLVPLLAAIHELIPWIRQWHAGDDPVYGGEPADFFEDFLRTEAAARGMTVAEVIAWQPPARTRAKRATKKASKRGTKKKPSEPEAEAT
jgi:hypothetical protein